jgi:hypothetical protein
MKYSNELIKKHTISSKNLSTFTPCKKSYWHTNQEFKERRTMMDIRREYDKKMKKECIWGAVFMVVAFGLMVAAMVIYG